jgi:hypothetical protein
MAIRTVAKWCVVFELGAEKATLSNTLFKLPICKLLMLNTTVCSGECQPIISLKLAPARSRPASLALERRAEEEPAPRMAGAGVVARWRTQCDNFLCTGFPDSGSRAR